MELSPTDQAITETPPSISRQPDFSKKYPNILTITLLILAVFSLTLSGLILYRGFTKPVSQTTPPTDLVSPTPIEATNSGTLQITQMELEQGWYWGSEDQKKAGTPDAWIFTGKGTRSAKWQKPETVDTSLFQCPATEWVDCMPTIGDSERIECTNDFLSWAKINCPNFKGAAM